MLFIIRIVVVFCNYIGGDLQEHFFQFLSGIIFTFWKASQAIFLALLKWSDVILCIWWVLVFSSLANLNTLPRAIPLDDRPLSSKKMEVLSINSACLWFQKVIPNRFDSFSISKSHIFRKNEEIILNSKSHCLSIP